MPLRLEHDGHEIRSVEDWFEFAPPMGRALQWQDGRSAKELAKAWCRVPGAPAAPAEFVELLAQLPQLGLTTFDTGYPECRVPFDRIRGEPRNADLALVCSNLAGSVAISVEAKADESFGRFVSEEIMGAASQWSADERSGKLERLQALAQHTLPRRAAGCSRLGELRYQLLTAIAGCWAFAGQHGATKAVFVIHEFVSDRLNGQRQLENSLDLNRVVQRVTSGRNTELRAGQLIGPLPVPPGAMWTGVAQWYVGKCVTDLRHLV